MTDIDMLLRDTLRDRAATVPGAHGLLAGVRTRSRRLRNRRRLGVAGVGVATVLLAAASAPAATDLIADHRPTRGGVAGPGSPTSSSVAREPAPSPSTPAPFPVTLGPPGYTLPVFPFTPPTDAIPGLPAGRAGFDGSLTMSHYDAGSGLSIAVRLTEQLPHFETPASMTATERPTQVRGVAGTLRTEVASGYQAYVLYWSDPASGSWLTIRGGHVTVEQLVAYADGLRPGSVAVTAPFTFDLLPRGLVLDQATGPAMTFRIPGSPAGGSFEGKLAFVYGADGPDPTNWTLTVGPHKAFLQRSTDGVILQVYLGPAQFLVVQLPPYLTISDADLIRLAAGVHVNPGAEISHG